MEDLGRRDGFVRWLRHATPYVHAHRGRTFVISFGGEVIEEDCFGDLVHDLAMLHGLGIRLVLVHGARPQIEARLARRQRDFRYAKGLRITDAVALACVKEAIGVLRVEIEAKFSQGLAPSHMAGVRIPLASGNFVIAKPLGVLEGIDYQHTGTVRRIDHSAIRQRLDAGAIVLISPLGYSPTGEVFNLSAAEVARTVAIALRADKLIFLLEEPGFLEKGQLVSHLLSREVPHRLEAAPELPEDLHQALKEGAAACDEGVDRVHLISSHQDGALLRELFTREGIGTLIAATPFETLRQAQIEDVGGILELIAPLEASGILVRRSRERLEMEIQRFFLLERDGLIIACAALYPYPQDRMGELACLAVHPEYRGQGRGDRLLAHLLQVARQQGLTALFVLTTQTAHWFLERGFRAARLEDLPMEKRSLYNFQRNAKVFIKAC